MKYSALFVFVALIGACYAKPVSEQSVTADVSTPAAVSDSPAKSEAQAQTPQENPTQASDALKSTVPAGDAEKIETAPPQAGAVPSEASKDEAKNAKIEATQNPSAAPAEQAQENKPTVAAAEQIDAGKKLIESAAVEEQKPVQQQQQSENSNVVSSSQEAVKENYISPTVENTAVAQDAGRSIRLWRIC